MEKVGIVDPYMCEDLCKYIRGLLLTFIVPIWLITSPFITYIFFTVYAPNANNNPSISEVVTGVILVMVGISGLCVDLIIILLIVHDLYMCHIQEHLSFLNKPKKQHYPNIFIEYLKARKQKICPLLEFKDN